MLLLHGINLHQTILNVSQQIKFRFLFLYDLTYESHSNHITIEKIQNHLSIASNLIKIQIPQYQN